MSTKRYCDGPCGKEITEASGQPDWVDVGSVRAWITFGGDDQGDDKHVCRYCLLDALVKMDDRPKESCVDCELLNNRVRRIEAENVALKDEAAKRETVADMWRNAAPACDHAELVRLVKEYEAAYTGQANCSIGISLVARDNLLRYARTLP